MLAEILDRYDGTRVDGLCAVAAVVRCTSAQRTTVVLPLLMGKFSFYYRRTHGRCGFSLAA